MMDPLLWLVAAGIVTLGAFVQSASGFGIAIVSIPLLTLAGLLLPDAVAVVIGAATVQAVLGLRAMRATFRPAQTLPVAAGQWIGTPLEVVLLVTLLENGPELARQTVGGVVIVFNTLHLTLRAKPRKQLHVLFGPVAGLAGGLLGGLVGIGGPPLVFFAMAHTWDGKRFRSFLWWQLVCNAPVVMTMYALQFGGDVLRFALQGALCVPVIWLGTRAGLALSGRWSRAQLMVVAAVLLYAVGLNGLLGPLLY